MPWKLKRFATFLFLVSTFALAHAKPDSDPYNTYLWNRDNHLNHRSAQDTGDWFEWWYYKLVDPQSGESYFFTYGVVNPWDLKHQLKGSRAMVQVGNFADKELVTREYPVDQFSARYDVTAVRVGENYASDRQIVGNVLTQDGKNISWNLTVDKKWSFDAMGWGMRVPEVSGIYWYPAQASATMTGWVNFAGKLRYFDHVPAYQDRNWGRSFPKWWTWIHSNVFDKSPGTTLSVGGGVPKIFNKVYTLTGLCIGFFHQGIESIFRTTDADFVHFNVHWGVWEIQAENRKNQRIEISAYAPQEKFMNLQFPTPRGEIFNDYEALNGHLIVRLFTRANFFSPWKMVTELESNLAGIEWGSPETVNFATLFDSNLQIQ